MLRVFWIAWLVESLLVLGAVFFLTQPAALFEGVSLKARVRVRVLGWAILAMLFCWSVVLGSLVVLYRYQHSGGFY